MKVSSNLFAGAGANVGSADGGALSFNVAAPSLFEAWYNGSAYIYHSLLVRVLTTLLPLMELCRLIWAIFRRKRGGPSVPLQYFTLLSFVYYIYGINRWNRLTLFHLLIISQRKEVKYEPFYPYY